MMNMKIAKDQEPYVSNIMKFLFLEKVRELYQLDPISYLLFIDNRDFYMK